MSVHTNNAPVTSEPAAFPRRTGLRLMRWAVNLWLVFHILAIIIAPASVDPSSDLVRSAWTLFQPYLQVLYLNHGYHFSPPSRVRARSCLSWRSAHDGSVVNGRIPNFGHQTTLALSPAFHVDRTHEHRARGAPEEMARLLRSAPLPQVWRDSGQPDTSAPITSRRWRWSVTACD